MKFDLQPDDLRPLIKLVVSEVIEQLEEDRAKLDGRLAYTEPEAAALLGIQHPRARGCPATRGDRRSPSWKAHPLRARPAHHFPAKESSHLTRKKEGRGCRLGPVTKGTCCVDS